MADQFGGVEVDEFGGVAVADEQEPIRPEFADLSADQPLRITEPPTSPLLGELTTFGGGRKPLATYAETMQSIGQEAETPAMRLVAPRPSLTEPRLDIPDVPIQPDEGFAAGLAKEAVNVAAGLPEFFTSDAGVLSVLSARLSPRLTSAGFSADLTRSAFLQARDAYKNWNQMTGAEKGKATADVLGTMIFGGLAGAHAAGVKLPKRAPKPQFQGPIATGEVLEMPSRAIPPVRRLPKPELPTEPTELPPTPAVEAIPAPVAKEIITWDDAVADLRSRGQGTETKQQVQTMFPQLQLSREAAGGLAKEAFGDKWIPGGEKPQAKPAPKQVTGFTPEELAEATQGEPAPTVAPEAAPVAPNAPAVAEPAVEPAKPSPEPTPPPAAPEAKPPEIVELPSLAPNAFKVGDPVDFSTTTKSDLVGRVVAVEPDAVVVENQNGQRTRVQGRQIVPVSEAKPSPVITEKAEPSPVPPVAAEVSQAKPPAVPAAEVPPAISQAKPSGEVAQVSKPAPPPSPRKGGETTTGAAGGKASYIPIGKLEPNDVKAGDLIQSRGDKRVAGITGKVIKANPKTLVVETDYMGKPMQIKIPRSNLTGELRIIRNNQMYSSKFQEPTHQPAAAKVEVEGKQADPPKPTTPPEPIGMGGAGPVQGSLSTPPIAPSGGAVAPANVPVKAISQIIRDLSKGLNVPIRFGRLTTTKFAGYFKPIANLIGSKKANQLPVVSHEVGHKLDSTLKISSDPTLAAELDLLGDPARIGPGSSWTPTKTRAYKMGEGVAEFVRQWIDDPVAVGRHSPNLTRYFENLMNTHTDLGGVLRQAQEDVRLWKNAPALARLDSSIVKGGGDVKARYTLSNLTRDLVDDLHFLRLAAEEAGGTKPLGGSKNPYVLARLLRGTFGMADTFIRKGIVDFSTKSVRPGTSLEDILKPVSGRLNDFRRFIVAKRAKELRDQGRESGLVPSDVDEALRVYQSEPEFQATFDRLKEWNDSLLQYALDAGMLKRETVEAMRKMNQDYVPFHRLFEIGAGELSAEGGIGTGRGLNVGTPGSLKQLRGSTRDIVDPLETMARNAYAIVTAAEKNAVSVALGDLARQPNMGKWVERIRTPIDPHKVTMGDLRKRLEDMGADVSMIPDDAEFAFFRKSGRTPYGENIIKVVRDGQAEYFRLNGDLYETFQALDYDMASRFIRYFSAPSQILRAGVTLNPDFALANIIRDTVSSAVISRYGSTPFYHTLRGVINLLGLGDKKVVAEWMASGGKQAVESTYFDSAKIQRFLKERVTKDLTPTERAMFYAKSPVLALRMLSGLFEEGTRVGQYELVYKKLRSQGVPEGDARRMAAFEARDLQDFAKGGANTKSLRMMTAFWNAALQGNVRLAQAFKERPIQTTIRGMAFITLPKLVEQAINWDNEDYWDRPQWERDLFFLFPYGKDANGKTKFIRVPTPFEVGVIFGTVPGRMLQTIRERDPEAAKTLFWHGGLKPGAAFSQFIPNPIPQWLMTMLETVMGKQGYSIWRQRPIVPTSLADQAPELQFTEQTSLTARKAGKMLGLSPAKIDYALQGTTGGLGRLATHQGLDRVISAMTGEPRTAQNVTPGGRFVTVPAGIQSAAVEKFYEALDKARMDKSRLESKLPTTGEYALAPSLEKISRRMGEIRAVIRTLKNPDDRQRMQLEIVRLAKLGSDLQQRNKK